MPKLKTNRGAAKRFRCKPSGAIKCNSAYRRHILTKKSTKRKRNLRAPQHIHQSDLRATHRLLPYS